MAEGSVRREVDRTLVAGSWDAVKPDNFRSVFPDERMARDYITEMVGFRITDTFLFGIVRVRFEEGRATVNRKGWGELSESTRKGYEGSYAAKVEAAAHNLTVPEWYAVAPDLKTFRRKATGRTGREQSRLDVEFIVYITRKYKQVISSDEVQGLQASIRAAHQRQVELFDSIRDQLRG